MIIRIIGVRITCVQLCVCVCHFPHNVGQNDLTGPTEKGRRLGERAGVFSHTRCHLLFSQLSNPCAVEC